MISNYSVLIIKNDAVKRSSNDPTPGKFGRFNIVMIIDLDAERGRISLSTKALEPEPGDMLTDPQKVFDKAEEMAARYKQMLLEQAEEGEEPLSSMMV